MPTMNMHYTYLLYSKKLDTFYIGSAKNLKERLYEHNQRQTPFTKKGIPWEIIYYEAFVEKADALREELFLKSGKGRERRKYLLKSFLEKRGR